MTATLSLGARRRAPLGREELRRQLLALVLAFVLVWYTFVVPAGAAAGSPRRFEPDDDGHDGEVRGVSPRPFKNDSNDVKGGSNPVEELDWPEYIYP